MFGIKKLESLGYCVALFEWSYVCLFGRTLDLWWTKR